METLDEVIKAKELCELNCSDEEHCQDCPYAKQDANGDWSFFCHDCDDDALHYLKEYRDHMKNEIIELQEEVKKQKEMIEFLEKPLTWYELKQMEGKPIWIEYDSPSAKYKRWVLLCEYTDSNKITIIANHLLTQIMPDDYGKTWQAYRKERS